MGEVKTGVMMSVDYGEYDVTTALRSATRLVCFVLCKLLMQLLKKIYATPTIFLSKKFPTGPFELNMGPPNSTWVRARAHARKKTPRPKIDSFSARARARADPS